MTVNVAVWFNDTIMLLADLGVTAEGGSDFAWGTGPLGQRMSNDSGESVLAETAKVARVGTSAAATVCGELRPAKRFLRALQEDTAKGIDIRKAILGAHSYAIESDGDFCCFVAAAEGSEVVLFWSTELRAIRELNRGNWQCPMTPGACVTGSLTEQNRSFIVAYIKNALSQTAAESDARLAKVLACANVACVQLDLVAENVSGPIFGISVTPAGAKWQPDILYVPWTVDDLDTGPGQRELGAAAGQLGQFPMVACYVRDDVLCVKSMISETHEYFPPEMEIEDPWPRRAEWHAAHDDELFAEGNWTDAKYYVFLPSFSGSVVGGELLPGDVTRSSESTQISSRLREKMEAAEVERLRFVDGKFPEEEAHTLYWLTAVTARPARVVDKPVIRPHRPNTKAPCPCGSGKLYRDCHGRRV